MFKQNFTGVGFHLRLNFASVYVKLPQKRLTKYIQLPVSLIKFLSRPHVLNICHSLKYSNEPLVYVLN